MVGYRLLFTGRLLLACVLSARTAGNDVQAEEATKILHAASAILRHFVTVFPVALGSAEVLDETTRVCRVSRPESRSPPPPVQRFAWYRPIAHQSSKKRGRDERSPSPPVTMMAESSTRSTQPSVTIPLTELSPIDATFFREANAPTLSLFNSLDNFGGESDFSWLLPGAVST